MELYCDYTVTRQNIGGYDPEDSWSRDSHTGDYVVNSVHLSGGMRDSVESPEGETFEVGDIVHVAYVVYTSGDTFGYDGGYSHLLVATKDIEVAMEAEKWAREVSGFGYCEESWAKGMKTPPYPSWVGYFESIDAVRIFTGLVQA
jgi:hypothetical protein